MPSPLDIKSNDLAVKQMAPQSPTDLRVPTAEEFDLDSKIGIKLFRSSRIEHIWQELPTVEFQAPGSFSLSGRLTQIGSPVPIDLSGVLFSPPPLENTFSQIDREDKLYLVGFTAEVSETQDPLLGQFSYGFAGGVNSIAKENTRRYRSFWVLFYVVNAELTINNVITALGTAQSLPINNKLDQGFSRSGYQVYAKDPNLVAAQTYKVLTDTIDVSPVLAITRKQNISSNGYSYGLGGEVLTANNATILADRSTQAYRESIEDIVRERFLDLSAGITGRTHYDQISTVNLAIGSNSANPGNLGISALSLNGSYATANDQRINFSNQATTETRQSYPVTVALSNTGNLLLTTGLNTNAPPGSKFNADKTLHKIYKSDGTEQSLYGTWTNLSGTGGLQWVGTSNSTLIEGETAYIVPAIDYPAGSGFEIPFQTVLKAWRNAVLIDSENIRLGHTSDLDNYVNPSNSEEYILVFGPERMALHYIYHKISITIPANGTAIIPPSLSGCFAFIEGVPGRIDRPVKTGLTPGVVNALIYHAPRSTETWQFQFANPEYQGLGSAIEGEICGTPLFFGHSLGGGGSVFRGELSTRYQAVSAALPSTGTGIASYLLDTPIQLSEEEYRGPVSFRELEFRPGSNGAAAQAGSYLRFDPPLASYPRSLNQPPRIGNDPISCYAPALATKQPYQAVFLIPLRTDQGYYLLIATKNTLGGEDIILDPALGVGIDLFHF